MKTPKTNYFVLIFAKITGALPALIYFKPRVFKETGAKVSRRLPAPSILVSNHTSFFDFPLYLLLFPFRTLHVIMAAVLFNQAKILRWFLYAMGGIKVDRYTGDFDFVSESLEILDNGGVVGIFPQGRLPVGDKPFPFKPGVSLIALNTDAPVVPVYTAGHYNILKRTNVIIGAPIDVREYLKCERKDGETDEELVARKLEEKIYELKADMEAQLAKKK